ncbi:MAG TPA: CvpA family protein, partial [Chitinophagaceae bacterium]
LIGVIFLVRWIANLIQAAINVAMLGWLNKLSGIILYLFIYLFVYSIFLFYLTKMNLIKQEIISASHTYSLIEPFGPKAIDMIGSVVPVFKNIFHDLTDFFEKIATNNA